MGTHSHERANSEIYRAFCTSLATKANNPIFGGVTVLRTELSADGSSVRVFLTVGGSAAEEKVLEAFYKGAGFFRTEIAKTVSLRRVPKISFVVDKGNDNASRVEELLNKIHGGM
jgi:ribosome-binding factor A